MNIKEGLSELKIQYYKWNARGLTDEEYELLYGAYIKLKIKVPEIKYIQADKTFAYVCPDPEGEFPNVYILPDDENKQKYMEAICAGIEEYYSNHYFYDSVSDLCYNELVAFAIHENQVPIVAIYNNTELLNIRWLNKICE